MRNFLSACFTLFAIISSPVIAQDLSAPPPIDIAARGYILRDFASGRVLAERNAHERLEPASITKVMSSYITFKALKEGRLKLDQTLTVPEKAWRAEGSRMFLPLGAQVKVSDLLKGEIIQSGNDASITLAEGVAGSEEVFAQLMNREAQRLGMKESHFVNSTGLPNPQHYTTPYDLSLLANALIRDFPEYYPLYSIKEFVYNNIKQANRNRLLWKDPHVDGIKTGHTEAAGYCLMSSAKRDDMRVVAVVLGTDSDDQRTIESQKLLNYGFQFFETHKLYDTSKVLASLPVWKGTEKSVKVGLTSPIFMTLPRGQYGQVKANIISQQPIIAPIARGQKLGTLRVVLGNTVLGDYPLVAMENVGLANIFSRMWDSLKLMMDKK